MSKDDLEKKVEKKIILQEALKKILENCSEEELLKYREYYKLNVKLKKNDHEKI